MSNFVWTIGVFMLFAGMSMQECNGKTFALQLSLIVSGALIAFGTYLHEEIQAQRKIRDQRIEEMKRRMRDAS